MVDAEAVEDPRRTHFRTRTLMSWNTRSSSIRMLTSELMSKNRR